MKPLSNWVAASNMQEALDIIAHCLAEGFKAVASQNLNSTGYTVEYWK